MYWRLSFYELTSRIKLKLGELSTVALCNYTAFAEVARAALGGGDGGGEAPKDYEDLAKAPSYDAALANINSALSFG